MTLPAWVAPLPDAVAMRALDTWATAAGGVASLELMERAGVGVAALAAELLGAGGGGGVVAMVGKGNNGGDALVAARLLRGQGATVEVILAGDPGDLAGDARINLERLPGEQPRALAELAGTGDGVALILDGLLGTGFVGAPRGLVADAITAIGRLAAKGTPVLAIDVPSGVDASNGEVSTVAVRAQATATLHAGKPGLWIEPGRGHAGVVHVIDIGIPAGAPQLADCGLIDDLVLELIPRRATNSTKFTSGHVLVAGGSPGLTGAPCLAARAAQRAGAGYVTVAVPASLSLVFEAMLLEAMTRALPDADGAHTPAGVDAVLEAARRGGALVLGSGLGREPCAAEFARELAARAPCALVLDADGLNAHAGALELLQARSGRPTVLTPHEAELGRLLGCEATDVGRARLHCVREAARRSGAVVVLKGDDTLVADPTGVVCVSAGATPALASAGTGDVLAGVTGALLAKGLEPLAAAAASVRLHALAGRRAAARHGTEGVIASDVIEEIAQVRAR